MSDIHYKIEFHSLWHCGSGLSAGADIDTLVIKDKNGLPFIPGKTLKGIIREAVEDYVSFTKTCSETEVERAFGQSSADNSLNIIKGEAFFSNATLDEDEQKIIISQNLEKQLYDTIASTAIDEKGIAEDHSLRRKQVVIPCTLYATIQFVDESLVPIISQALGLVKRMGVNRNRGLGRCTLSII